MPYGIPLYQILIYTINMRAVLLSERIAAKGHRIRERDIEALDKLVGMALPGGMVASAKAFLTGARISDMGSSSPSSSTSWPTNMTKNTGAITPSFIWIFPMVRR